MLVTWSRAAIKARTLVLAIWIALTAFGLFGASNLDQYLTTSLTVPGSSSATANEILNNKFNENTEGTFTVIFRYKQASADEITGYKAAVFKAAQVIPGAEVTNEKAFEKLAGMFAFILFDIEKQIVYIVRDRFGIKPLYYGNSNDVIYVSSEMRALLETKVFSNKLNTDVLPEYVSTQTVHFPNTIIEDIYVLEPGHYLKIDKNKNSKKH
mgnify:CR=1 FL=1